MSLSHNQMAYAAIISTLIFGSLFVGFSGYFQTSESIGGFESAAEEDLIGTGTSVSAAIDTDGDGLSDLLESTQYGTNPELADTDFDGMSDGWEVAHGLNPLDNGESEDLLQDPSQAEEPMMPTSKMKQILGQTQNRVQMVTLTTTVSRINKNKN
jgi:hypothetical protein